LKCHLELIYQYVKTKVNKILASSILTPCKPPVNEGYSLIDYCISLLSAIIDQPVEFMGDVPNYFYFSGYLSGILLGDKPVQQWPFIKVSHSRSNQSGFCSMHVVQAARAVGTTSRPAELTDSLQLLFVWFWRL
jgi:hypothetical protein